MSSIPDEFYQYLQQKGYTNLCRGDSTGGNYVVPNVQVDSVQVKKNEIHFLVSYPLIKARFDPKNQEGRWTGSPTNTVDALFFMTGGENAFKESYEYYTKGTYDENARVFGNDSIFNRSFPERYVTDTEISSAATYNMWVNESGVFKMDDVPIPIIEGRTGPVTSHGVTIVPDRYSRSFTNYLIGCLIKGVGYENIELPMNGQISNMLKDAGIVKDAVSEFYKKNKGKKNDLEIFSGQISGDKHSPSALFLKGIAHPETLIGSGYIIVSQYSETEILVKIFDIKSITSGDISKHIKFNDYPKSLVRDTTKTDNRYTNTSQTYSFTLPIDFERLEKGK